MNKDVGKTYIHLQWQKQKRGSAYLLDDEIKIQRDLSSGKKK